MKILPVSFSFKSTKTYTNIEHPFLYTSKVKRKTPPLEHFTIATGVLAFLAVAVTLINVGKGKKF